MSGNLPIVQLLVNFRDEGAPPNLTLARAVDLSDGDGRGIDRVPYARGRSQELGQVQTGTLSATVDDPQETLNPANPASPFVLAPYRLVPYRGCGLRAWWPHEGNMINSGTYNTSDETVSPGLDSANPEVINGWSATPNTAGAVDLVAVDESLGSQNLRIRANGPTAQASPMTAGLDSLTSHYWMLPGRPHTYSVYVRVDAASTGTTVWLEAEGATSATTTGTSFTRLSVTFTPTSQRTPIVLHMQNGPTGALAQTVYLHNEQLELGSTPTTWSDSGPVRYRVWTGYVERWPLAWENNGFWGVRPLEAVDALAVLARTEIRDEYQEMCETDGAALFMPLDDTGPPGRASGVAGSRVLMREYPAGRGSTYQWGGATVPDGDRCLQIGQQVQNPADVPYAQQIAAVYAADPTSTTPLFNIDTRGGTVEGWFRIFAGEAAIQFQSAPGGTVDVSYGLFGAGYSRHAIAFRTGTAAFTTSYIPARVFDADWHYFAISFEPATDDPTKYRLRTRLDDRVGSGLGLEAHRAIPITNILAAARSVLGDPESRLAVARLAYYPAALSDAQTDRHYRRGIGYEGETAQSRAARILDRWWRGPRVVHAGAGRPMGTDHSYSGGTALAALEDVGSADDGMCVARADGTPVMQSSLTRARKAYTGIPVFGEDAAAGELPYASVEFDFDPGEMYSRISVSRPGRSSPLVLVDETVEALIGPRTLSRSVNVDDDYELEQVAITYRQRYGQTRLRVKKITLHPHANPDMWPTVLTLDVSDRVTVRRRVPAGFVMSGDYYIESVKGDPTKSASTWPITYELSPVPVDRAWVLGDPERGVLGSTTSPAH